MLCLTKRLRKMLGGAALLALFVLPATALLADEPVLMVSGLSSHASGSQDISFTMEELRALPETEFATNTIWTKGQRVFRGVSLHTFLEHVGADGETLKATAANDYSVEIPASDAAENGPIIAYEMDQKALTVRDKGPLWIVYPYDHDPKYQTEAIYSRSIWQLVAIEVIP